MAFVRKYDTHLQQNGTITLIPILRMCMLCGKAVGRDTESAQQMQGYIIVVTLFWSVHGKCTEGISVD